MLNLRPTRVRELYAKGELYNALKGLDNFPDSGKTGRMKLIRLYCVRSSGIYVRSQFQNYYTKAVQDYITRFSFLKGISTPLDSKE